MADRFYSPDQLGPGEHQLVGAEAHHLAAVRRIGPGAHVILFNGDGNEYPAEVVSVCKRAVVLNIVRVVPTDRELSYPVILASALPKADRTDFLVEKATELGVARFIPLITARSVVHPKDTVVEKLNRAVIEASKQCGRNRLMVVEHPQRWEAFVVRPDLPSARRMLHTAPTETLVRTTEAAVVGVGPEGGFTSNEVEVALAAGWQVVSLGPRTLRVETAALAAVARLQ